MTKSRRSDSQPASLYFHALSLYFGPATRLQEMGLRDAARLLSEGRIDWGQVSAAIDRGWDPGRQTLDAYLDQTR